MTLLIVKLVAYEFDYPTIQLKDLDIGSMKLIKHQTVSNVYYDAESEYYHKIWKPNYKRIPVFQKALELGFFDGISIIDYIIIDESSVIRGYSIRKLGSEFTYKIWKKCRSPYLLHEPDVIKYSKIEQDKLVDLFQRLAVASLKTNIFYLDISLGNIKEYEGRFYLIDLDSIYTQDEIKRKKTGLDPKHIEWVLSFVQQKEYHE